MGLNLNYVFYDLETSGLSKPYDQIFQFGAIHADADLNSLSVIDLRCNRLPELIPSPKALLITRVSPKAITTQNLSHYEMTSEVVKWISDRQPATFIGHNSIDFDENFLRYGFYKTLNEPYLTQAYGSYRADTMIMSHAVSIHDEQALQVPLVNGKKSFRLGPLARLNGCLLYTSPSPRDATLSRMPSSA